MRRILVAISFIAASSSVAHAAFNPNPSDICHGQPATERPIDPDTLLWRLLTSHSISPPDLQIGPGDNSYTLRSNAILNPGLYCQQHTCGKDTERGLTAAQDELLRFWNTNAHTPGPKDKFYVSPPATDANPNPILEKFFRNTKEAHAVCLAERAQQPSKPNAAAGGGPEVRIRKSTTDLRVKQSSKAFKGLERASFSLTQDYVANTRAYDIEGVVGVGLGPIQLNEKNLASLELIPYVGYTRQLTQGGAKATQNNVDNVAVGLIGDWIFPIDTYYQDFQFYPQLVHSNRTDANVLSGNAVFTPDFPIPGIGGKYLPYQGAPVSFLLTVQVKTVFGEVVDAGHDPTLSAAKDFVRVGPRVGATIFGEDGIFAGWSLGAIYEYQRVLQGQFTDVSRFDATLAYTMPGQEFWSLQLKYSDGRDLNTLERLQQLTLGVGLKY